MLVFIRCSLGMGILNVQQNKIFKNTVIPVGRDEGAIPWLSVLEGLAAACKIGWFGSMFQITQDLEKGGRDFNFSILSFQDWSTHGAQVGVAKVLGGGWGGAGIKCMTLQALGK